MKPRIKKNEFYTPNEIVRMGVLKGDNLETRKQMVLRYIRQKRLKAKNLGTEARPRYVVRGEDLKTFASNK